MPGGRGRRCTSVAGSVLPDPGAGRRMPGSRGCGFPVPGPAPAVESVVVTANKLKVETLIDRKVYTVTSDVQSTFGTVSDILGVIPSVDVDPDGNVSLRGDSERPDPGRRPAVGAVLRARPPATICSPSRPRTSNASR